MKKLTTTLTVLSLGALLTTPSFSQERRGGGDGEGPPPQRRGVGDDEGQRGGGKIPPAIVKEFDKNGDGKLDATEAAAARKALAERRKPDDKGGKGGDKGGDKGRAMTNTSENSSSILYYT